jgi:hypothetical protein
VRHHLDRFADEYADDIAERDPDELIDTKELAKLIHVSKQWVEKGRSDGYGPPFVYLKKNKKGEGSMPRYGCGDTVVWLRSRAKHIPK